jgi:hypothetical protein
VGRAGQPARFAFRTGDVGRLKMQVAKAGHADDWSSNPITVFLQEKSDG